MFEKLKGELKSEKNVSVCVFGYVIVCVFVCLGLHVCVCVGVLCLYLVCLFLTARERQVSLPEVVVRFMKTQNKGNRSFHAVESHPSRR